MKEQDNLEIIVAGGLNRLDLQGPWRQRFFHAFKEALGELPTITGPVLMIARLEEAIEFLPVLLESFKERCPIDPDRSPLVLATDGLFEEKPVRIAPGLWVSPDNPHPGWLNEIIHFEGTPGDSPSEPLTRLTGFLASNMRKVRAAEKKYRLLSERMAGGLAFHRLEKDQAGSPCDYTILSVNPAFVAHTGLARTAVEGKLATVAYGTEKAPYLEIYSRVVETGIPEYFEVYFPPLDRHFKVSAYTPEPGHFATIFSDITDIRRSSEALSESREWFRTTLYSIGDGVITTDSRGVVTMMNPVAETLTGWAEADAAGRHIDEIFKITNEYSGVRVDNPVEKVLRAGRIVGLANHTKLTHRNGTSKPIADSGAPIRNSEGAVTGAILVFRDQSAERIAEKAIKNERDRARHYLDIVGTAVVQLNQDGSIGLVNRACCDLLDSSEEELLGKNWFENFVPASTRKEVREVFESLMAEAVEPVEFYENEVITTRGEPRNVAWRNSLLRDSSGLISGTLSSGEDITERKRILSDTRDREQELLAIYQNCPSMMLLIDSENRVRKANMAVTDMTGFRPEEITGLKVGEVLGCSSAIAHPDCCGSADSCSACTLSGTIARSFAEPGRKFQTETALTVRGDEHSSECIFLLASTGLEIAGVPMVIANLVNISESKKFESQMRQAARMEAVGRLAGGVAHDFNNMLQVIKSHAELALSHIPPDNPLAENLLEVQAAAERSSNLTRQLLAFARKQNVVPKIIDLNLHFESTLKLLKPLIGENITLKVIPSKELWNIRMDPSQIDQIMINLIVNARDAITGHGMISVKTRNVVIDNAYCRANVGFRPGEYVSLEVADDGCGMAREVLDKVFEPFFSTKGDDEGTGLGLSTVYGIVRQNEGLINVYSEPGLGTTFSIYFPRVKGNAVPEAESLPSLEDLGGSETILLVEDEKMILKIGLSILQRLGYNVLSAATPREAVSIARSHGGPIHLLLTDVVMPDMNGRELCEKLSLENPGMRCLYMSGYTADVMAHSGIIEEEIHFLQKPFSLHGLACKVRQALKG